MFQEFFFFVTEPTLYPPCTLYILKKEGWAKKILADAAQEKQGGILGKWQQESPFREVLEQVKRSADTDCNAKKDAVRTLQRSWAFGKASKEECR